MDDVELTAASLQHVDNALGIGIGLAKTSGTHNGEFGHIWQGRELSRVRNPERIRVTVEVKAWNRSEADPWVEFWVGLAGKDFNAVAQVDEFSGQVTGVDPLATTGRVATVDEKGNAQSALFWRCRDNP